MIGILNLLLGRFLTTNSKLQRQSKKLAVVIIIFFVKTFDKNSRLFCRTVMVRLDYFT